MELSTSAIQAYLQRQHANPVELIAVSLLGDAAVAVGDTAGQQRLKTYGYGRPLLVQYRAAGAERQVVLRTMAPNGFGHERRADRAANLMLSYDTFNTLPHHIRALDLGVIANDGQLRSVAADGEYFLLTDYAPGRLYAEDLEHIAASGSVNSRDLRRAHHLATTLASMHALHHDEPMLYRRHLHDVFGSGEGIAGLLDSYSPDFVVANPGRLEAIERRLVTWRWRLKAQPQRLSQIHGDFHPFNLLFDEADQLTLLDRSRGPWGEPADDVSCMAINYLFFSLRRSGTLEPPFSELWDTFWATYLAQSCDEQLVRVIQPFFAWRALVLASPAWYHVSDTVREVLFHFVENILNERVFDPWLVSAMLKG
jgi:hypothetical protein